MTGEQAIREFGPMARRIAARYYLPGGDREDLEQEAMIGILRALKTYRPETGTPLRQFVALCVDRWLITQLKKANRGRALILTDALREIPDDEGGTILTAPDAIADDRAERIVEAREELARIVDLLPTLTRIERTAVLGVMNAYTYEEIDAAIGLSLKGCDNAVQRARRKLRAAPRTRGQTPLRRKLRAA